ncbi:hypothetical protein A2U01_0058715, partial [Trifolium medium]|nr:hypothetical protein [Trifolium medium]
SIPRDPGGAERLLAAMGWLRAVQLALAAATAGLAAIPLSAIPVK